MIRNPLAARFLNAPLALLPAHASLLLEMLRGDVAAQITPPDGAERPERRFDVVGGVAVIPVNGCLVHGQAAWWWDEQSYDSIRNCLAAAVGDEAVKAIALHVNSPGGMVAGCFDLVDAIYAMRGTKPIHAIVDEAAYSAAYALASAADRIIVPRTGGVGSIGVITMRPDITGMLDGAGIKITTVKYGALKDDGYPTSPVTDAEIARVQADVDRLGELFVDTVARNRGIAASKVRKTEAGTFLGDEGVTVGLADAVMSPDEAFLALLSEIG